MAKTLYLMRHGQTMLNKQRRIQGWFDSPLTDLGRYQARAAGAELQRRGVKFDRAICSTSERCSDTLELVFDGMELPVMPYARLHGLKEMFYGELDGESERLACDDPLGCRTYYVPFGGESSDDVRDRVVRTLAAQMEELPEDGVLLAVSHGGACFNFARALRTSIRFGNCAAAVLSFDPPAPDEQVETVDSLGVEMPADVAQYAAAFELKEVITP